MLEVSSECGCLTNRMKFYKFFYSKIYVDGVRSNAYIMRDTIFIMKRSHYVNETVISEISKYIEDVIHGMCLRLWMEGITYDDLVAAYNKIIGGEEAVVSSKWLHGDYSDCLFQVVFICYNLVSRVHDMYKFFSYAMNYGILNRDSDFSTVVDIGGGPCIELSLFKIFVENIIGGKVINSVSYDINSWEYAFNSDIDKRLGAYDSDYESKIYIGSYILDIGVDVDVDKLISKGGIFLSLEHYTSDRNSTWFKEMYTDTVSAGIYMDWKGTFRNLLRYMQRKEVVISGGDKEVYDSFPLDYCICVREVEIIEENINKIEDIVTTCASCDYEYDDSDYDCKDLVHSLGFRVPNNSSKYDRLDYIFRNFTYFCFNQYVISPSVNVYHYMYLMEVSRFILSIKTDNIKRLIEQSVLIKLLFKKCSSDCTIKCYNDCSINN